MLLTLCENYKKSFECGFFYELEIELELESDLFTFVNLQCVRPRSHTYNSALTTHYSIRSYTQYNRIHMYTIHR
jgi:hypothetical protein